MVRPNSSDRGAEKFVQWKEPPHSAGGAPNGSGEASTSRGRKKKLSRSLGVALGGGSASERSARVEDRRHNGSASTLRAEADLAHPSPVRVEETSTLPPRRINTTPSPVPNSRSPSVATVARRSPLGTTVLHEDEVALTHSVRCM